MRFLAVLLVPAFIGFVSAQMWGQGHGQGGINYPDRGRAPGGSSRQRYQNVWNNAPANQQQGGGINYPDAGRAPGAGGSSRQGQNGWNNYVPANNAPGFNANPNVNGINQVEVGRAPLPGGSSRGLNGWDTAPVVNQQPISGRTNHQNVGAAPVGQGGSSGGRYIPDGPVQTGMSNRVNMVDAGTAPEQGNSPNSGEFLWDTAGTGTGALATNDHAQSSGTALGTNNRAGAAWGTGAGAGGSSRGGNGNAPAYAGTGGSSGAAGNAPLGGALLTDRDSQNAGRADQVKGAASFGGTAAGVVIAVLVLVGVVGVAAVVLVKQRASRMMVQQV